jgi:heme exporter protein CcmD
MTHLGYLIGGYGVTFAALAGYVAWMRARTRALARQVPPEPDQRWR